MNLPQIIIILLAVMGVVAAVIAFLKTPKSERYQMPVKPTGVGYAPEYTTKERRIILLKTLGWIVPLAATLNFWFFPWLNQYSVNAHCHHYGNFTGLHIIFYGIFIGLPLLITSVMIVKDGKRSIKIIKLGQSPLPGEKVLYPTKYIYGAQAKIKAYLYLALILFGLGSSIAGYFWVQPFITKISSVDTSKCNALIMQSP